MFRLFAKNRKFALDYHEQIRARAVAPLDRGVFAKAKGDTAGELYLYETIGSSFWGGGVTAKDVVAQLDKLKGAKALDIHINSEGGDVFEGKAIFNSLRRFDAVRTVYIDGLAASAASFIAMAASPGKLITAENATWMIHEAWGGVMGSASDMRAIADELDRENLAIAGIYAARTGQPVESFWARAEAGGPASGLMASDKWMNAEEALAMKLTDSIEKNAPMGEDMALEKAAASIPAFVMAKQTQERIASARRATEVLAREQSLLNDRRRAGPGREPQRPAARTP